LQLDQGEIDCTILAFPIPKNNFCSKILGKDDFYIPSDETLVKRFQMSLDDQSLPEKSVFYSMKNIV